MPDRSPATATSSSSSTATAAHSLYGYLSSLSVAKGDRVDAQAPLGASGLDPSGNPALYFELRVDGQAGRSLTMAGTRVGVPTPSGGALQGWIIHMTLKTRLSVLFISTPVLAFVVVGGLMGKAAAAGDQTYQHLRVFEDVVSLVMSSYVEPVKVDRVMEGAMRGLADGLDPDSAFLSAEAGQGGRGRRNAAGRRRRRSS